MIEVALRLGAQAVGEADTPRAGVAAVVDELSALAVAGIVPVGGARFAALTELARILEDEAQG